MNSKQESSPTSQSRGASNALFHIFNNRSNENRKPNFADRTKILLSGVAAVASRPSRNTAPRGGQAGPPGPLQSFLTTRDSQERTTCPRQWKLKLVLRLVVFDEVKKEMTEPSR